VGRSRTKGLGFRVSVGVEIIRSKGVTPMHARAHSHISLTHTPADPTARMLLPGGEEGGVRVRIEREILTACNMRHARACGMLCT
jgi:hypothetical protein